jgi:hypothetical protein
MPQVHAVSALKHADAQSVNSTVSRGHDYGWGWLESRFMNPSPPMVFRMLSDAESADCLAASTLAFNLQPPPYCTLVSLKTYEKSRHPHKPACAPHSRHAHTLAPLPPLFGRKANLECQISLESAGHVLCGR